MSLSLVLPTLLSISLLFAPAEGTDYARALSELDTAIANSASADRDAALEALERAIEASEGFPDEAAARPQLPQSLLEGRVVLVRLYLAQGDRAEASEAMDALIRLAADQPAPVNSYGPQVSDLYADRRAALYARGRASIAVSCAVDCDVVVNQRLIHSPQVMLPLGTYQVWIRARAGPAAWEHHEVTLDTADLETALYYANPNPIPVEFDDAGPTEPKPERRLLPRGAELAGLGVGLGLIVAGALLAGLHGQCKDDPPNKDYCDDFYESRNSGLSLLGVGGGLLVVSGVLLGIDEVRVGKARATQVTLGVTLQF